jgi:DNA relaxase NicK
VYEVEFESRKFQVEVEILENTANYIHVAVSVDDGSLPASIRPLTDSFIHNKDSSRSER